MTNKANKANKADLINYVAAGNLLTLAQARCAVDGVLDFITERCAAGEKVMLKGFGSFEMRETKARMGRNPQTGEPVPVAAYNRMAFRAAKKAGA